MQEQSAYFRCIRGCKTYPLSDAVYVCDDCGDLLEIVQGNVTTSRSADQWRTLFASRAAGSPGPDGSGVWRYREWLLPDLPKDDIVTLGEGATPLVAAQRLSEQWGVEVLLKQCGHSLSGSFKDLGMTVLISQVNHMVRSGKKIPAIACASTGDTSAALAAYGAAAGLRTLVLLPKGKISAAQLVQPMAQGARVIAIDTDFDGCMEHVTRLCDEAGVYLANSKNSLRIEGQKTVAFEIAQGLNWQLPDWVAIPGGNLGNVSALVKGFTQLHEAGLTDGIPRILCAQAALAAPLYRSFVSDYAPLQPVTAGPTQASAIRIGNPVSFPKAVAALKHAHGVVAEVTEQSLAETARDADHCGLYVCPHTAVALAAVRCAHKEGTIQTNERVVVVATAHGLKFTEFKHGLVGNSINHVDLGATVSACEVPNDFAAVKDAALGQ